MIRAKARTTLSGLTQVVGPFSFMFADLSRAARALFLVCLQLAFAASLANAQDYIDVEAERRAQTVTAGSPAQSSGATSYGVSNAPSAASSSVPQATTTRTLPPPPASDNIGGLFNQVQQLQQEVMRLNGLVEQQAYEIRTLKEQSLERYMDLDRRLASGSGAAMPAQSAGSSATAAAGAASSGSAAMAPSRSDVAEQPGEGEAYRAAYALVRGQEFDQAVQAFNAFLQRFPGGRYAPNAHYWLGELYLVTDPVDAEASRQAFMLLLNEYPNNPKIPDALYKLGRVHFIKGNLARSREFLDRVIRDYPDSSAARLAGDFIDQNL